MSMTGISTTVALLVYLTIFIPLNNEELPNCVMPVLLENRAMGFTCGKYAATLTPPCFDHALTLIDRHGGSYANFLLEASRK